MRLLLVILLAGCALAKQGQQEKAHVRSPQAEEHPEVSEDNPDISNDLASEEGSPIEPTPDNLDPAEVEAGNAQARAEGIDSGNAADDILAEEDEAPEEDAAGEEAAAEEKASGACRYAGWWSSFDRAGWSLCKNSNAYVNGLWRNDGKGNNDGLFLIEKGYCCDRPPVFGSARRVVKNADWSIIMDKLNTWGECPRGYFLNGFYRSNSDKPNLKDKGKSVDVIKGGLHNLEKAKCSRPQTAPVAYGNCYEQNVGISFDKKGLSKCKAGYFMTGLWKGTCDKLYCVEKWKCCRMRSPRAALPKVSNCGPLLKTATGARGVPSGWTLCYLDKTNSKYADTPCKSLLKGSAYKGKGFGCWHGRNVNDNDMGVSACKPNVQNDLTLNDWPQYPTIFGVCFRN